MLYYTVVDKLAGEVLHFLEQYDAELEAELRLEMYHNGYIIRKIRVKPVSNAVLKVEGRIYNICTR